MTEENPRGTPFYGQSSYAFQFLIRETFSMQCRKLYSLIFFFTIFVAPEVSAQTSDFIGHYHVSNKDNSFSIRISNDDKQWKATFSDNTSNVSSIQKFGLEPAIFIPLNEKENRDIGDFLKLNEPPQCINNRESHLPVICKTTQHFDYAKAKIKTELFMIGYGVVLEMEKRPDN